MPLHRSTPRRSFATVIAIVVLSVWAAPGALAHTAFESSDPADGAVVQADLDTITVTFTNEAEPAGEGFVVRDPALGARTPDTIDRPSGGVFVLHFDPAISSGEVGVRWTVQAPDAHPIEGTFRFTVEPEPTAPAPASPSSTEPTAVTDSRGSDAATSLQDFLADESGSAAGRRISDTGRLLSMAGMLVSIGFLAFATLVLRGTRAELRTLLFWIRRAAVAIVVGTVLDCAGHVADVSGDGLPAMLEPGAYLDSLSAGTASAYGLRIASGIIVAATARLRMVHVHAAKDVLASVSAAVPVGAGTMRVADHPGDQWGDQDQTWDIDRAGVLPVVGMAAMLLSHTFDGHTVTEGNRVLTGLASATHVLAAAVWAGGVFALALVIRGRRRAGQRTNALLMVTRFSVLATGALAVVMLSGLSLSWVIIDRPADLWDTPWGRLLMAKIVVVATAVGLGARNHRVIVPALEQAQEDGVAVDGLRATLRAEVAMLALVTAITALLVRAASTV